MSAQQENVLFLAIICCAFFSGLESDNFTQL